MIIIFTRSTRATGSIKWRMNLNNDVRSSPTIGDDGTIYVGSDDNKVWAINRLAQPRNIKNLYVTSTLDGADKKVGDEIVFLGDLDDWLAGDLLKGPWAVRMEVNRSLTKNGNLNYEYTLRTWIRQCATVIASSECDDPSIIGTFFQDTRLEYDAKPPHLTQTIELDPGRPCSF